MKSAEPLGRLVRLRFRNILLARCSTNDTLYETHITGKLKQALIKVLLLDPSSTTLPFKAWLGDLQHHSRCPRSLHRIPWHLVTSAIDTHNSTPKHALMLHLSAASSPPGDNRQNTQSPWTASEWTQCKWTASECIVAKWGCGAPTPTPQWLCPVESLLTSPTENK